MGYYVRYEGTITVPADEREAILDALKNLNHRHDLKSGRRWPAQGDPYEDRWFSWMPPRYHETVESVEDVLELLGFGGVERGSETHTVYYDDKAGSEDVFLRTLVEAGGSVELYAEGEDGELWRYVTRDGEMVEQHATVTYED